MKVDIDGNDITIYLNNLYLNNLDLFNVDILESYMNKLFLKLKNYYDIKLQGYYDVELYIDDNYGAIIVMKNENIEYYEYLDNQIDTKITIHNNSNFLYEIEDIIDIKKILETNYKIYKYDNKFFLKLLGKIKDNIMTNLLEYIKKVCYNTKAIDKIKNLICKD